MSHVFEPAYPSIDRVVDLLETYADARMGPRGHALARVRRHVMATAAARDASGAASLHAAVRGAGPRRWSNPAVPRYVAALGLAAAMTFGTSAAVLAAPPGSPFYNARVALEQVFLPSRPDHRVAGHEALLNERLHEAQAAADSGNSIALQAALTAYQAEIDHAVADVGDNPELVTFLEGALSSHEALLEGLATRAVAAKAPQQTAAAIAKAIHASAAAAKKLHATGQPPLTGQQDDPVTPPTANGGGNQGGAGGAAHTGAGRTGNHRGHRGHVPHGLHGLHGSRHLGSGQADAPSGTGTAGQNAGVNP